MEFMNGGYSCRAAVQYTQEKRHATTAADEKSSTTDNQQFIIEDLLDFSNEDAILDDNNHNNIDGTTFDCIQNSSADSSSVTTVVDSSCNSYGNDLNFANDFPDVPFSNDLCVPYDDLAELEWLSTFGEETFSSEDLQKLQIISGIQTRPDEASEIRAEEYETKPNITTINNPIFNPELPVPGKARSKRSRAAPNNWSSRLLVLSPTTSSSESDVFSNTTTTTASKKTMKVVVSRKREFSDGSSVVGDGRKCLHCATDKTPQWRTGPLGPKTLCNACGVRYKSGRLVPEYRPASSPTFVQAKHSNSHRKVLELRRKKEMDRSLHQQFLYPNPGFNHVSNGDDYLIHHHSGPDYRQQLI